MCSKWHLYKIYLNRVKENITFDFSLQDYTIFLEKKKNLFKAGEVITDMLSF